MLASSFASSHLPLPALFFLLQKERKQVCSGCAERHYPACVSLGVLL